MFLWLSLYSVLSTPESPEGRVALLWKEPGSFIGRLLWDNVLMRTCSRGRTVLQGQSDARGSREVQGVPCSRALPVPSSSFCPWLTPDFAKEHKKSWRWQPQNQPSTWKVSSKSYHSDLGFNPGALTFISPVSTVCVCLLCVPTMVILNLLGVPNKDKGSHCHFCLKQRNSLGES